MKASFKLKALAAVLALGAAGSAMANTNLGVNAVGSITLNMVDTNSGVSYLYDTGYTTANFTGTANYTQSLSSDVNYQAFVAATGTDIADGNVVYSVLAVNQTGAVGQSAFTTVANFNNTPANGDVSGTLTTGNTYEKAVNLQTSATTNSAFVNSGSSPASYNQTMLAGWGSGMQLQAESLVGSAMDFYKLATSSTVPGGDALLTQFQGQWNIGLDGTLTFTTSVVSAVPTPASWGLLLSGLALMGVIARRKSSSQGGDFISGAAA